MNVTTSNTASVHKCDVCGVMFTYPSKYRPWGAANGTRRVRRWWWPWSFKTVFTYPKDGEPCCPCLDCDPEAFRECIVSDLADGTLKGDITFSQEQGDG